MALNYSLDIPFIICLFKFRFLQTGQLSTLLGRSGPVVRRRLRKFLIPQGYAKLLPRNLAEEAIYTLGEKGFELIAEQNRCDTSDLPYSKRGYDRKPGFWHHNLLVNNTRIKFELALRNQEDNLYLADTIAEWEFDNPAAKLNHEKYLLWERLEAAGRQHTVRPDHLFAVEYPDGNLIGFYVEADRRTEPVSRDIRNKLEAYRLYFQRNLHKQRFGLDLMALLFVLEVNTDRRLKTFQKELQLLASRYNDKEAEGPASFVKYVRLAKSSDLNQDNILTEPIWVNWQGETRSLWKKD